MELSGKSNDHMIGLMCAVGFLVLTLGIPFTGILGGFYEQTVTIDYLGSSISQHNECMWDGMDQTVVFIFSMTINVDYDNMEEGSQAGVLWNILGLWGTVYLLLTLIGGGLVAFYAFAKWEFAFFPYNVLSTIGLRRFFSDQAFFLSYLHTHFWEAFV